MLQFCQSSIRPKSTPAAVVPAPVDLPEEHGTISGCPDAARLVAVLMLIRCTAAARAAVDLLRLPISHGGTWTKRKVPAGGENVDEKKKTKSGARYQTAAALDDAVQAYVRSIQTAGEPYIDADGVERIRVDYAIPPTVPGLLRALGLTRDAWRHFETRGGAWAKVVGDYRDICYDYITTAVILSQKNTAGKEFLLKNDFADLLDTPDAAISAASAARSARVDDDTPSIPLASLSDKMAAIQAYNARAMGAGRKKPDAGKNATENGEND